MDLAASRSALERMWARKLDEVVALDGACCRMSAAGDNPHAEATPPSMLRLSARAARAYEELGVIADAINAIDRCASRPAGH